ncbi:hypothetical protein Taro_051556 [Colocasia esculenta]|uniref:Uncharacterized protein n=1 Tax=Colocasia esculenta TaxID=4460 RepID=A0A843XH70_COLES|nr:hypothetical protein [Colocasia esculenta]
MWTSTVELGGEQCGRLVVTGQPEPSSFPTFSPPFPPTCTLVPLHYFRWSTGACGKAVKRAAAADQAGNDGLEDGIRGKLLRVRCKSRFYRGKILTTIDVAVSPSLAAVDIAVYPLLCELSLARLWSVRGRRIWIWSLKGHKYPGLSHTGFSLPAEAIDWCADSTGAIADC